MSTKHLPHDFPSCWPGGGSWRISLPTAQAALEPSPNKKLICEMRPGRARNPETVGFRQAIFYAYRAGSDDVWGLWRIRKKTPLGNRPMPFIGRPRNVPR